MSKLNKLVVENISISIVSKDKDDYICLTDMANGKGGDARASDIIKNWIRNRGTIEYLGTWESIYNPNFKVVEFDHFRKEAGLPTFVLSVSNWVEKTNAIGIFSKSGKLGGTYAHRDIAFEFGAAISPIFKLYLFKEYQRLKELESNQYNIEWSVKRVLSKVNYEIHTDAIKKYVIPKLTYSQKKEWIYADEADLLNIVLFGYTAKQWREANPQRVLKGENIRDIASINELAILSNIESLNAILNRQGMSKKDRFKILSHTVKEQKNILDNYDFIKSVKKQNEFTYIDMEKNSTNLSSFDKNLKRAINFKPKDKD
jgi:hypothetical protein